jgi:hypothetical protein
VRIAAPTNLLRIELTIFFLSLIMIALQAMHPSWRHHTLVDGYFAYYDKVSYFLKNNTLQGIPFNEYQPGAIFYFLSVAPILAIKDSRETYLNGLILSNLLLCMGYGWIILKQKNPGGLALFSAMLMLGGPLILFRFELYSHLLVLAGLLLWQKKREYWGAFMLGVSTTVKVYPLLLVPLLLKNAVVHKEFAKAIQICISYAAGIVAALLLYMVVFHVSAQEVLKNVLVHSHKPLHIESISGSITIWKTLLEGQQPKLNSNLIHGVHPKHFFVPLQVYLYAWIIPVLLFYVWWYRQKNTGSYLLLGSAGVLSIFLVFVSQLGPQYLYWFLLFIPLVKLKMENKVAATWFTTLGWLGVTLIFSQTMFPLFYDQLLQFFVNKNNSLAFMFLTLRNISLVIGVAYLCKLITMVVGEKKATKRF